MRFKSLFAAFVAAFIMVLACLSPMSSASAGTAQTSHVCDRMLCLTVNYQPDSATKGWSIGTVTVTCDPYAYFWHNPAVNGKWLSIWNERGVTKYTSFDADVPGNCFKAWSVEINATQATALTISYVGTPSTLGNDDEHTLHLVLQY